MIYELSKSPNVFDETHQNDPKNLIPESQLRGVSSCPAIAEYLCQEISISFVA
jgi:hypothetical protein